MITRNYEDYEAEIKRTVNRFIRKTSQHLFYQQEDLYQEATLKFLECCKTYKEGPVPFSAYLKHCIQNHLTDYVRKEIKYNRSAKAGRTPNKPFDNEEGDDYLHEAVSIYLYQDEEETYKESLSELAEKDTSLTEVEVEAIKAYDRRKGKVPTAARDIGVTREAFYGILNRAVAKLKEL